MDMVADMDKGGWAEWAEEGAGVEPTDTDKMGARGHHSGSGSGGRNMISRATPGQQTQSHVQCNIAWQ